MACEKLKDLRVANVTKYGVVAEDGESMAARRRLLRPIKWRLGSIIGGTLAACLLAGVACADFDGAIPAPTTEVTQTTESSEITTTAASSDISKTMDGKSAAPKLEVEEPISPIPLEIDLDAEKVRLGKNLFSDSRLSVGNGVSCATCHIQQYGLTDGAQVSPGLPGAPGVTNTLSLYNVGLNPMIGWAGQFDTLEQQADYVVRNKSTMNANWQDVVNLLKDDKGMVSSFDTIFDNGITRENIISAIVEYEKSLVTYNAPFDRFLRGDKNAISEEAKAGYKLFKEFGCSSCHQGVNVGGNMLQVFGIFGHHDAAAKGNQTPGAARNTGIDNDRPVFRVPSLRNVDLTGPYFHNGSVPTLEKAIRVMAANQLGRNIAPDQIAKLKAFLESLTGEIDGKPVSRR